MHSGEKAAWEAVRGARFHIRKEDWLAEAKALADVREETVKKLMAGGMDGKKAIDTARKEHPRVSTNTLEDHGKVITLNKNTMRSKTQIVRRFLSFAELPTSDMWSLERRVHDARYGHEMYGFTFRGDHPSLQPGDQLLRVNGVGLLSGNSLAVSEGMTNMFVPGVCRAFELKVFRPTPLQEKWQRDFASAISRGEGLLHVIFI